MDDETKKVRRKRRVRRGPSEESPSAIETHQRSTNSTFEKRDLALPPGLRDNLISRLEQGAERGEIQEKLEKAGYPPNKAQHIAEELDDRVQDRLRAEHAQAPVHRPTPVGAWINMAIGGLFILGGMSGEFVMKGTNSGGALAVFGLVLIGWGIYRVKTA